jgi:two-component system sensor kinase FixL
MGQSVVKLDTIFQSFYSTKREGLGLGPSISTLIVEAHNARRWAKNNADRGATFCFTVPVADEKPG